MKRLSLLAAAVLLAAGTAVAHGPDRGKHGGPQVDARPQPAERHVARQNEARQVDRLGGVVIHLIWMESPTEQAGRLADARHAALDHRPGERDVAQGTWLLGPIASRD